MMKKQRQDLMCASCCLLLLLFSIVVTDELRKAMMDDWIGCRYLCLDSIQTIIPGKNNGVGYDVIGTVC